MALASSSASREMVGNYAKSLDSVRTKIDAVFLSKAGEEQITDGQLSALLRGWIPKILIGVVPHYGRHYWTRADSRKNAQGECLDGVAGTVTLNLSGCKSGPPSV